ncbi:MAG: class III signal peptide-containing protein [Elusimicrobiaceae bacterium]|nr:class III signal peptide-containing protein [Elusimicrobiaceae bacterium]
MKKLKSLIKGKRGQNTVEYLLILAAIVGVALVVGIALKNKLPAAANEVMTKITGAIGTLSTN